MSNKWDAAVSKEAHIYLTVIPMGLAFMAVISWGPYISGRDVTRVEAHGATHIDAIAGALLEAPDFMHTWVLSQLSDTDAELTRKVVQARKT